MKGWLDYEIYNWKRNTIHSLWTWIGFEFITKIFEAKKL